MMKATKPCPFCGAKYGDSHDDWCFIPMSTAIIVSLIIGETLPYTMEELTEAWNIRYEPTCQWKMSGLNFEDTYATSCGGKMIWEPCGVPAHCPGCGARVEEVD